MELKLCHYRKLFRTQYRPTSSPIFCDDQFDWNKVKALLKWLYLYFHPSASYLALQVYITREEEIGRQRLMFTAPTA
jgi:hypothetical protein